MSQLKPLEYVRSGQPTFFRLPNGSNAPTEARAAVLGIPYDLGATHHPGARFAPWTVRDASVVLQTYHPFHRVDVFESLACVDGGNVVFPPFDAAAVRECIRQHVSALLADGIRPFIVGGDHSVALPVMRAMAAKHGPLTVLHFDAHLDTSGPEAWGEEFHHGSPLRHALQEGLVAPGGLFQVGVRATWATPEDGALVGSHQGNAVSVEEVAGRGAAAVAKELRARLEGKRVYVTFDVDAVDPAYAPGTGTPVPGGLTSREALALLRGLAGIQLVGMDVVEVCPALDVVANTSLLAAHLLYEGLALAALRPE